MARGRKRKAGLRHPSGKLVQPGTGELQREAMATVIAARQRHYGVTAKQASDERLGTALGRLAFAGKVTAGQYAAGEMYGEIMARNRIVMGLPPLHPHSAAGLLLDEGISGRSTKEVEPEFVARVRRRAAAAILVLKTSDSNAPARAGRCSSALVHAVVCYDTDTATWSQADQVNLCHGLDGLVHLFRIGSDSS